MAAAPKSELEKAFVLLAEEARRHEVVHFSADTADGSVCQVDELLPALRWFFADMRVEYLVVAYAKAREVRSGFAVQGTAEDIPALRKFPKAGLYWLAIQQDCDTVFVCHNHPGLGSIQGALRPSDDDIALGQLWQETFCGSDMSLRCYIFTRQGWIEF